MLNAVENRTERGKSNQNLQPLERFPPAQAPAIKDCKQMPFRNYLTIKSVSEM